jgi:hypothetical protein
MEAMLIQYKLPYHGLSRLVSYNALRQLYIQLTGSCMKEGRANRPQDNNSSLCGVSTYSKWRRVKHHESFVVTPGHKMVGRENRKT